jgi:hypothetical protein
LKNDGGVSALVGGRIFSGIIPQDTRIYPAIAYRPRGTRDVVRVLGGGCALVSQQFDVFVASKANLGEASRVDNAVTQALDEYRGTVGNGESPEETITIQQVFSALPAHSYAYDDKTETHQFITSFEFHYLDPMRL